MEKVNKGLVGWALVVVAIIVATFLGVRFPIPEPPPDDVFVEQVRPVQFRSVNVEQNLSVGKNASVAGDVTVAGSLSVVGGVSGTNVVTTGNQTIAGIKTFTTPAAFTGGITGPLSVAGQVVATGPTAAATATPAVLLNNTGAANNSLEVQKNATPVAYISNAGGVVAAFFTTAGALTAESAEITVDAEIGGDLEVGGDVDITGDVIIGGGLEITGTLAYDGVYPVGFASAGQVIVYGTSTVTTTLAVTHGLTTVTWCNATLAEDPGVSPGEAAAVSASVATNACTVKTWQDDFSAATVGAKVHWIVIGEP